MGHTKGPATGRGPGGGALRVSGTGRGRVCGGPGLSSATGSGGMDVSPVTPGGTHPPIWRTEHARACHGRLRRASAPEET